MRFYAKEVFGGFRAHPGLFIAVVLSLAVSLLLTGAGLLFSAQINTLKEYWYDKVEVSVFLCSASSPRSQCPDGAITDDQRQLIKDKIESSGLAQTVYYESSQAAYERFIQRYKGTSVEQLITPDVLPESYRIKLVDPKDYEKMLYTLSGSSGIEQVVDIRASVSRLFNIMATASRAGAALAVGTALITLIIIANTTRIAALSRRKTTEIMALVGASPRQIWGPYLLEIFIASTAASGLYAWGLWLLKTSGFDATFAPSSLPMVSAGVIPDSTLWSIVAVSSVVAIAVALVTTRLTLPTSSAR